MYIFTKDGILSCVQHRSKPGMLMVRSVAAEDLRNFWPNTKIIEMAHSDYRFRIVLPREAVAARIAKAVAAIAYDKVKPSVAADRADAYFAVWSILMAVQEAKGVLPRHEN